jgi:hypothetical protein
MENYWFSRGALLVFTWRTTGFDVEKPYLKPAQVRYSQNWKDLERYLERF